MHHRCAASLALVLVLEGTLGGCGSGLTLDHAELFPPVTNPTRASSAVPMALPDTLVATAQTRDTHRDYTALRQALIDRATLLLTLKRKMAITADELKHLQAEYDNRLMDGARGESAELQAKHAELIRHMAVLTDGLAQVVDAKIASEADAKRAEGLKISTERIAAGAQTDAASKADLTFLAAQTTVLAAQEAAQQLDLVEEMHRWPTIIQRAYNILKGRTRLPASSPKITPPGGQSIADVMPALPAPPTGLEAETLVVTVRFDHADLDYAKRVNEAVNAVESRSGVKLSDLRFDVLAITPLADDESGHLRALSIRERIAATGVPTDHIALYSLIEPTIGATEVRIYLKH